ncbi:transposase [Amycolatopsis tucumanensis]|uniref:transposase n=1 Tax=Amycolatopsis tucumanensis TaxID=401106 RepID=UPI0035566AD5
MADRAWARIEPLLPVSGRGRRWRDHRQVLNAILWKPRTGAPWRLRAPGKRGLRPRRRGARGRRGRTRTLPRRTEHHNPPRRRWPRAADAGAAHRRPRRRQPTTIATARRHRGRPNRTRQTAMPTRSCGHGQGLLALAKGFPTCVRDARCSLPWPPRSARCSRCSSRERPRLRTTTSRRPRTARAATTGTTA